MNKLTTEEFIRRARNIHGHKYDYSLVNYINSKTKVKIICPEHNIFEQRASHHLSGSQCKICSNSKSWDNRRTTLEQFLEKAHEIHGDKYDYSLVDYKGVDILVIIVCLEHKEFLQTPYNHTHGSGCIRCAYDNYKGSWKFSNWEKSAQTSKNFDGYKIYFLALQNDEERFFKIGRTFLPINLRLGKNIPYEYHVLTELEFHNARECCERENDIHNNLKDFKYIPKIKFNGYSECYRLKNIEEDVRILIEFFNLKQNDSGE